MERHLISEDARGAKGRPSGSIAKLARDFSQALLAPDVALARRIVNDAVAAGVSPGSAYVNVVRPALSELQTDAPAVRMHVAAGIGRALVADLVGALPMSGGAGGGRAALLSCCEAGIEQIDGDIATDFLDADGWVVDRLTGPQSKLPLGADVRSQGLELAVAVVTSAEDALRLAPACTELNRLPDPPVVLLCDFTGRPDWPAASTALGADAFISDPQELMIQAAKRLPGGGNRRWGVRIARDHDALVLAPIGQLNGVSTRRLAEVAESRIGSFSRLVVDLRDLAEISTAGIQGICDWRDSGPLQHVELQLIADSRVRSRIDALDLANSVPLTQAAAV